MRLLHIELNAEERTQQSGLPTQVHLSCTFRFGQYADPHDEGPRRLSFPVSELGSLLHTLPALLSAANCY